MTQVIKRGGTSMRSILISLILAFSLPVSAAIDLVQFEKDLNGNGVIGEVHGATSSLSLYVFSFRDPENFFDHVEFPLTTENETIRAELKKLGRHDSIKIRGKFLVNKAPIKHIDLSDLTVVKKFEGGLNVPAYKYQAKLPEDLVGKSELVGKVHAIAQEGKILVIEYKDAVIPVYVSDAKWTKDLYRNDKIKMQYKIRSHPEQPTHVSLDVSKPNALTVTDSAVQMHGKPGAIEGYLILFPKSPQVLFNVFAVQHVDANGVKREFTLVNFEDPKVFEKIRLQLQEWWDKNPGKIENARNKYINYNVKLRATGTFNVVDAGQANPQILLNGPEDLTLIP